MARRLVSSPFHNRSGPDAAGDRMGLRHQFAG